MIDVNGVEEGPKVLLDKGPGPALQSLVYARMGVANRGPWQAAKVAVGAPLLGPGSELPYHQSRSGAPADRTEANGPVAPFRLFKQCNPAEVPRGGSTSSLINSLPKDGETLPPLPRKTEESLR